MYLPRKSTSLLNLFYLNSLIAYLKSQLSTFRLDNETRKKLVEMTEKLSANQVDVVTFAIKQVYSLFEDTNTVKRIHAIIQRKLRKKSKN